MSELKDRFERADLALDHIFKMRVVGEVHQHAAIARYELGQLYKELATLKAQLAERDEMKRQRNLLAKAIGEAALKAGIVREDADLTGPHLLMLCDDLAALTAERAGLRDEHAPINGVPE